MRKFGDVKKALSFTLVLLMLATSMPATSYALEDEPAPEVVAQASSDASNNGNDEFATGEPGEFLRSEEGESGEPETMPDDEGETGEPESLPEGGESGEPEILPGIESDDDSGEMGADPEADPEDLPEMGEPAFDLLSMTPPMLLGTSPITVVGDDGNGEQNLAVSNNATFYYGSAIALTLEGVEGGSCTFSYFCKDTETKDAAATYDAMAVLEPGSYALGYYWTSSDGESSEEDDAYTNFGFKVVKAPLHAAENLTWTDGTTASWDGVTTDINGLTVSGSCEYTVDLYKNGSLATEVTGVTANTYDFTDYIVTTGGIGEYTFSVRPTATLGQSAHYADAAAPEAGDRSGITRVVALTVAKDSGISAVTPVSTSYLITGSTAYAAVAITATPSSPWTFDQWTGGGSLTVADATSASTTVSIPDDYSGDLEVSITAAGTETVAPVIESFEAGTGSDAGKLVATVMDADSGLTAYAFSTETDAGDIAPGEWTSASGTTKQIIKKAPAESGTYYFYAKDACGNIAQSVSTVAVDIITFDRFYTGNTKKTGADATRYYIGEGTFTLPATDRNGYSFGGWFDNESFAGDPVTELTSHTGTDRTFYAKWTKETFSFATYPSTGTTTYTGNNINYTVALAPTSAEKEYAWFKGSEKVVDGATLSLRDVADSGIYTAVAYVTYQNDAGDDVVETVTGDAVTLTVAPAALTVRAANQTTTYGSIAPEFTFDYEGLVGADVSNISGAGITEGTLGCNYDPAVLASSHAGNYAIVETTSFTALNYNVTFAEGTLTVAPKSADGLDISLTQTTFSFSGSAHEPGVIVKDGGVTVDSSNFTVTYENNITVASSGAASAPTVHVTFKNDYTGLRDVNFNIVQTSFGATTYIADWTYGDEKAVPTLSGLHLGDTYTFYYLSGDVPEVNAMSGGSTAIPTDAGIYTVYAVIDASLNYSQVVAAPHRFEIHRKVITLTADDASWEFDGNEHTQDTYVQVGTFVEPTEYFLSIEVTGAITNVGSTTNAISYRVSASTNEDNYDIQCINGTLTITSSTLQAPDHRVWDNEHPGTGEWVAISKNNLNVFYEVKLYSTDGITTPVEVTCATTAATSYDFSSAIHSYLVEGSENYFYFTVKTMVSGGSASGNYATSLESDASDSLYTATIYLTTAGIAGLDDVYFTSDNYATTKLSNTFVTLIQGESVRVGSRNAYGYTYVFTSTSASENSSVCWKQAPESTVSASAILITSNYYSSTYYGRDGGYSSALVTITGNLTHSIPSITLTAYVVDEEPSISSFNAANVAPTLAGIQFSGTFSDKLGLASWRLEQVREYEYEVKGKKYTAYTETGAYTDMDYGRILLPEGTTTYAIEVAPEAFITEPGTYRLRCWDTNGSTYSSYGVFTVYKIDFAPGEGATGTMSAIFKLANTKPELPLNKYTRPGYTFKNWYGPNTGISVDGAQFAANKSDTLTAQWTNQQYNYRVNYYYMDDEGNYPATPDDTAQFTANHGTIIYVTNQAIQKEKLNYTLDLSGDHAEPICVTGPGLELDLYYSIGLYTITYTYTMPGAGAPTVTSQAYYYGASVTELTKPSAPGYDFVGWEFEGAGAAPATMPAKNLSASGYFRAKNATYKVVYYLEDLGSGETKTNTYTIDDGLTETLNSKHDNTILAKLLADGTEGTDEYGANEVAGFTVSKVALSYGAPAGSTIPAGASSTTASGLASNLAANQLYINYYLTRNVYTLSVEVWQDSRENPANKRFWFTEKRQYQEGSLHAEQYANDSYYTENASKFTPSAFVMPTGYVFTSYTDYSTGNCPSLMPAGDVTIIRDIISDENDKYFVDIYFETTATGIYKKMNTLTYEAPTDCEIVITDSKITDSALTHYLNYNTFVKTLNNSEYYSHIVLNDGVNVSKETGIVTSDDAMTLSIYFERKYTDMVLTYYYGSNANNGNRRLADVTLRGKWGTTYTFNPTIFFDADSSADWVSASGIPSSLVKKDGAGNPIIHYYNYNEETKKETTTSTFQPVAGLGGKTALEYDFRNNSYLVSYNGFYRFFNNYDVYTNTWPSYTFTTIGNGSTYLHDLKADRTGSASMTTAAGIGDYITCYFGVKNNTDAQAAYMGVYYNEIASKDDFYLEMRINTNQPSSGSSIGLKNQIATYTAIGGPYTTENAITYGALYNNETNGGIGNGYVPITYDYDANGNHIIDADEHFRVRVMNMCAIVDSTPTGAAAVLSEYPAANTKVRQYEHNPNSPKAGFHRVGTTEGACEYYYYDGTGAVGTQPAIYIADPSDRFIQGAYTSYSHNYNLKEDFNGTYSGADHFSNEYKQVNKFREDYVAFHSVTEMAVSYDENYMALANYNVSWGSSYVYGDMQYLTYTYYYKGLCQLKLNFAGDICNDKRHFYVEGTRVPKSEVYCEKISELPGYDIVWYMNSSFTTPIPEDGIEMNGDRTVYGRYEKSTIPNMEYVYYQLADPITIGPNTYNYVTQDNLAEISGAGFTIDVSITNKAIAFSGGDSNITEKIIKITTYSYDGAVVMVATERPTLTYTELHLTKEEGGLSYEEAYGKPGFYFDETNINNRSYGYVNTSPIILKVYFARDKYQVEVNTLVSAESNAEYKTFSIDQKVILDVPVKNGYAFTGWTWKKQSGGTYVDYEPEYEIGETFFRMPDFNLQATANWAPAQFDVPVKHYFQTTSKVYKTGIIDELTGAATVMPATIDGTAGFTASVYTSGGSIIGAKIISGSSVLYYDEVTSAAGVCKVVETGMVVMTETVKATSEAVTLAQKFVRSDLTMFDYDYTIFRGGNNVISYTTGESFTAVYGMTLDYYYVRSADYQVRIRGLATDGGDSGLILAGGGSHYFGENINLIATESDGYTFLGWYDAKDILDGLPDLEDPAHTKSLTDYEMKPALIGTTLAGITPMAITNTYPVEVLGHMDVLAMVDASELIAPNLELTGKAIYEFGYASSSNNVIQALASIKTFTTAGGLTAEQAAQKNADAKKTEVTGYSWFELETDGVTTTEHAIAGQTASTYFFPIGKESGTYIYRCYVDYKRKDNQRSGRIYEDFTITVGKTKMSVDITNYSGVYDLSPHAIGVAVTDVADYEIYYSTGVTLTALNYNTSVASTTLPQYVHANNDGVKAIPYTTYIYVKDKTGNFDDYMGQGTVNITPRQVKIRATSAVFEKYYDGYRTVQGSTTDAATDMYKLSRGDYYEIDGILGSELEDTYILACDAEYNNLHVNYARSFTVSDMYLVSSDGGIKTYDYKFPNAETLTFSGNIIPRPLSVEWDDEDSFVYNGELQAPTVHLASDQAMAIPSMDESDIRLDVTGKQTNIGTYTANAVVKEKSTSTTAVYDPSDYSFNITSKNYEITQRDVNVIPVSETVVYDGEAHALELFTASSSGLSTPDGLVLSHSAVASPLRVATDAGVYDDMYMQDLIIKDEAGHIVNDNYNITYSAATLTISACVVTVSGITAEPKNYDGTTSATIHLTDAAFTPYYSQAGVPDDISLDPSKVSGAYVSKLNGTTAVALTIAEDALVGADAGNYILNVPGSQQFAEGLIGQSEIQVKPNALTVVYGEDADFSCLYTGIVKEDGTAGDIGDIEYSGAPSYLISQGGIWTPYVSGGAVEVGTYEIKIDISGLSTSNFAFAWDDSETVLLTVTKRAVSITSAVSPVITKTYDGNTSVNTSDITKTEDYVFTTVLGDSESGVLAADAAGFDLSTFAAIYNDEDVVDATHVTLTNMGLNNANYVLDESSVDLAATITKKDLAVTFSGLEIVYGTATPTGYAIGGGAGKFGVTYGGFVAGESAADLSGHFVLNPAYDSTNPAARNVGSYNVNVSAIGYESDNYRIMRNGVELTSTPVAEANLLTVTKAGLVITANDKTMKYKVGDEHETLPVLDFVVTGFKYDDTTATAMSLSQYNGIEAYLTTTGGAAETVRFDLVAGTYDIRLSGTALDLTNYTVTAKKGKLVVGKSLLYISTGEAVSLIGILARPYDGTTAISAASIDFATSRAGIITELGMDSKGNEYSLMASDETYLTNHPEVAIFKVNDSSAVYATSAAGTDIPVTVAYELGDYLAARYTLTTFTDRKTEGNIIPRATTVTAINKSVTYAGNKPAFGVTVSGLAPGDTLAAEAGTITYECVYSNAAGACTEVGTYAITPSGTGIPTGNYNLVYEAGTLTVKQAKLGQPTVAWVDAEPGKVTWTAVAKKGDVVVDYYEVKLSDDGGSTYVELITTTALTYDFASVMHLRDQNYTVLVKAVPSTENNAGMKNVTSGAYGKSGIKPVARIIPQFSGVTSAGVSFTADGKTALNMIAGETVSFAAVLVNDTGYVTSLSAGGDGMSASNVVKSGVNITGDFALSLNPTSLLIRPCITISERPATLSVTIASVNGDSLSYGYSKDEALNYVATVGVVDDNIDTSGYNYNYRWLLRDKNAGTTFNEMQNSTSPSFVIPTGYAVGNNRYVVKCEVTATRKDNSAAAKVVTSDILQFTIRRAVYAPYVSFNVSEDSWVYGTARHYAHLRNTCEEITGDDDTHVTWEYNTTNGATGWTTQMGIDVGTHYVRANIAETANYAAVITSPVAYTVTQATMPTPTNLHMTGKADIAQFGVAQWDAVTPPRENVTGTAIPVSYKVRVYEVGEGGEVIGSAIRTDIVTGTSLDIADTINVPSKDFTYTVQALSGDTRNCTDSGITTAATISIGADIVMSASSKVYDGGTIDMHVIYDNGTGDPITYQWVYDGLNITGATTSTYAIRFVSESGIYSCKVSQSGISKDSVFRTATITPRTVTVWTESDTKIYDASPLTNGTWGTVNLATGSGVTDVATLTVTGTITEMGTTTNAFTGLEITHGTLGTVVYSSALGANNNYNIVTSLGALVITKRSLGEDSTYTTGIEVNAPGPFIYDSAKKVPPMTVTDGGLSGGVPVTLVKDVDYVLEYIDNVNVGTATVSISGIGNYTGHIIRNFAITERTLGTGSSYNLGIGVADIAAKTFNGSAHTPVVTVSDAGLILDSGASRPAILLVKDSDYTVEYGQNVNVGTAIITISGIGNYTGSITKTFSIVKSSTLTLSTPANVTYNGSPFTPELTVKDSASGLTLVKDVDYNIAYINNVNAGTATVSVSGIGNYDGTFTKTFTIAKRPITIKSGDNEKVYDGFALTEHSYSITSGTVVTGQAISDGSIAYAGTITDVGTTANTPSAMKIFEGLTDVTANYAITYQSGTLTVTRKSLGTGEAFTSGITVNAPEDYIYDATAKTPAMTVTDSALSDGLGGYQAARTLIQGTDYTVGYINNVNAGTATVSISGIGNYSGTITTTYSIAKRPITITAASDSKIFDGTPLSTTGYSITSGMLVTGQAITSISSSGSQTNVGVSETTRSAAVIKAGTTDVTANYEITYLPGNLTVTQSTQVLVATSVSVVYDGQMHSITASLTRGDGDITYSANNGQTEVGTYVVEVTASSTANFSQVTTSAILEITKRAITITADGATKIYDGAPLTKAGFTITPGALALGQTVASISYGGSITDVGTGLNTPSAVVIQDALGNNVTSNYAITYVAGILRVTKHAQVISTSALTVTYDGAVHSITAELLQGDGTITYSAINGQTNAGIYTVEIFASETVNYESATASAVLTINKKSLGTGETYTSGINVNTPDNCTYSGLANSPAMIVTDSGLSDGLGGLQPAKTLIHNTDYSLTYLNNLSAGTATVKINGIGNYTGTITTTFTIAKRPITIKGDGGTKEYDGTPLKVTGYSITAGTLASGEHIDSVTFPVSVTNCEASPVPNTPGAVVIKNSSSENVTANYAITLEGDGLVVTKTNQTISTTGVSVTYDGLSHSVTASLTKGNGTISYSANNGQRFVGTTEVAITAAETQNYKMATSSAIISITKRAITFTASSAARSYNGSPLTSTGYSISGLGLASGDHVQSIIVDGSILYDGSTPNAISGAVIMRNIGGVETDVTANYDITYVNGTLTIGRELRTINAPDVSVIYDGLSHSIVATTNGDGTPTYSANNSLTTPGSVVVTISYPQTGGYTAATTTAILTVTKRAITIAASSAAAYIEDVESISAPACYVAAGSLAGGQTIGAFEVVGVQVGTGSSINVMSSAAIVDAGLNDVTDCYIVTLVDGTLSLTNKPIPPAGGGGGGVKTTEAAITPAAITAGGITPGSILPGQIISDGAIIVVSSAAVVNGKLKPLAPEVTGANRLLMTEDHIPYIFGRNTGRVEPLAPMTRAEAVQMFYNLLRDKNVTSANHYRDIKAGTWYYNAVNTLSTLGIIEGRGLDRFGPYLNIKRSEFTAMAMRFAFETTGRKEFIDVKNSNWAYNLIGSAANYGWIQGYNDGRFDPNGYITRAEVVTIMNHILGRTPDKAFIDANFKNMAQFPDLQDKNAWYFYELVEATNGHDYDFDDQRDETWFDEEVMAREDVQGTEVVHGDHL